MRFEAVVAEPKREQICRPAKGRVCASSVSRRDEQTSFRRNVTVDFFEFPRLNQWNISGNDESARLAPFHAHPRGHLDSSRLSEIVWIWDYIKTIISSELCRVRVASDDANFRPPFPIVHSRQYVL